MPTVESLSVVIPVFNDQEVLPELHRRLVPVLAELSSAHEIIFVDDGSSDDSLAVLLEIQAGDPRVVVLQLAGNFGQPGAMAAGLQEANGAVVVLMDSDLQDRPVDIPVLLAALRESDSAMAIARRPAYEDTGLGRWLIRLLFRVTARLTRIEHDPLLGVFRALDRSSVDLVKDLPASAGSQLSYLYWSGLSYVTVDLQRDARFAGTSSYTVKRKITLIAERIFAYSTLPFGPIIGLGCGVGIVGIVLGAIGIVSGWNWLFAMLLFLSGAGCLGLALIGEQMRRRYLDSTARPRYVTQRVYRMQRDAKE